MNFFFEKILSIFDIENWLWKHNFGTFWRSIIHHRIVLKQFPMLILGQNSCILGPPSLKFHNRTDISIYSFLCINLLGIRERKPKTTTSLSILMRQFQVSFNDWFFFRWWRQCTAAKHVIFSTRKSSSPTTFIKSWMDLKTIPLKQYSKIYIHT